MVIQPGGDIKPDNIFLFGQDHRPVVGDFGICHVDNGERLTLTDEAVGSRFFVLQSWNMVALTKSGPSSDIYSVGKLLYWLFAGKVFAREHHRVQELDLTAILSDTKFYPVIAYSITW